MIGGGFANKISVVIVSSLSEENVSTLSKSEDERVEKVSS